MAKYNIDTIRHSMAHLMVHAIMRVFKDKRVSLGIGPTIENGFYYDIDIDQRITEEHFPQIEEMMKTIIKENIALERKVLSRDEAIKLFEEKGQNFKVELIGDLPKDEIITCYTQGEFIDLCKGPHVEKTSNLPHFFKLLSVAGAYWRGSEKNKMLQRVYATCFFTKKELKDYIHFLEEAKKKDHRKLGKELHLFLFDHKAPGSPFFLPKGAIVYNELKYFIRRLCKIFDYQEVITPLILDVDLWKTSGHYDNYRDDMFFTETENMDYAIKPMNCPGNMIIYKHHKFSYRDLPLRFTDFGRLHRREKSGSLSGLTRVRTFTQDDGHIFLDQKEIGDEIERLLKMFHICYNHFKFSEIKISLSTRPEKRVGGDKSWDEAEAALKKALETNNYEYTVNEGEGAFYGPKIDFEIADALRRHHQLGTIQLDFQLAERFDLKFVDNNGELKRPVIIHRAILGSLERFFAIYLEHCGGAFPFWLAPEQAVIIPVRNDNHLEFASKLCQNLKDRSIRVNLDSRNESLGLKTRQAQTSKIPYMIVIGDKEVQGNCVSIRKYGEKTSETVSIDKLIEIFENKLQEKYPNC